MKLDINSIIKTIGASVSFEISDRLEVFDSGIGTVTFTGPVAVKGTATCFNRMIEVKGEAQVRYRTFCDRCGEALERHLTVPFDEKIIERAEEDQDTSMEDDDLFTYTGHYIDLGRIAANAILLNLPMQHLCGEDCGGLCPTCGKKLNGSDCGCEDSQVIDPRLESLKGYFKNN